MIVAQHEGKLIIEMIYVFDNYYMNDKKKAVL